MYRFRLVHAGVDGWLNLVLEDDEHVCKIWTVARDGHYFDRPRELNTNMLVPPGSRVDFLMKCSRASTTLDQIGLEKDSNMGILGPSMTWDSAIMSFQVTSSSHRSGHHEDPTSLVLFSQPSDLRSKGGCSTCTFYVDSSKRKGQSRIHVLPHAFVWHILCLKGQFSM